MRRLPQARSQQKNVTYDRATSRGAYHHARRWPRTSFTARSAHAVCNAQTTPNAVAVVFEGSTAHPRDATTIGVTIGSSANPDGESDRRIFAQRVCRSIDLATEQPTFR